MIIRKVVLHKGYVHVPATASCAVMLTVVRDLLKTTVSDSDAGKQ